MNNEQREKDFEQAAMDYCEDHSHCIYFEAGAEYGYQYALQHPAWIPVEVELPEKDNEFEDYSKLVIVTNGKDFWKGMYNYSGEEWFTFDLWRIDDATHWMEFVSPQRKEE